MKQEKKKIENHEREEKGGHGIEKGRNKRGGGGGGRGKIARK